MRITIGVNSENPLLEQLAKEREELTAAFSARESDIRNVEEACNEMRDQLGQEAKALMEKQLLTLKEAGLVDANISASDVVSIGTNKEGNTTVLVKRMD